MLRIGMIGLGSIAGAHLNAIAESQDFSLAAVCDINEQRAKEISGWMGVRVPYYLDYKEMCEKEDIDAVIINLPHFMHCEASVFCLERGIHVLCEKPMANTVEECDRMIAASQKNGAKLAIGHVHRFNEMDIAVKNMIDQGNLGKLIMVNQMRNTFYFSEERPRWFLDKKLSGGGIVMNLGAHALDKLCILQGGEISDIQAYCGNVYKEYDVEGHAQIYLKVGEIPCSITLNGYETCLANDTIYLFTQGAIRITNGNKIEICDKESGGVFRDFQITFQFPDLFVYQLSEFCKLIKGEKSISPEGEYGRKIVAAIQEIYKKSNLSLESRPTK